MRNKKSIKIPKTIDIKSVLRLGRKISRLATYRQYEFDFNDVTWVTPTGMLMCSITLNNFMKQYIDSDFWVTNDDNESCSYLAHMGFFKSMAFDIGKAPGEAQGNLRYLPITVLKVSEINDEASSTCLPIGDVIEKRSNKLASILSQQTSGNALNILSYSIREIMRNVVEHSNASQLEFCAQYWNNDIAEIVIVDQGIGIRNSLKNNPIIGHQISSDINAIQLSLMPGISEKTYNGHHNMNDEWANSGYGLYMTHRLCGNGGRFYACSGDACLIIEPLYKTTYRASFNGTVIGMRLNLNKTSRLEDILNSYRKDGEAFERKHSKGKIISASTASKMLLTDFEL